MRQTTALRRVEPYKEACSTECRLQLNRRPPAKHSTLMPSSLPQTGPPLHGRVVCSPSLSSALRFTPPRQQCQPLRPHSPANLGSQQSSLQGVGLPSFYASRRITASRQRAAAIPPLALVNIDFNPSLLLGMGLVGGGLTITSLRSVKPVVSRDLDIVIACVAWMSGGILIFQVGLHCFMLKPPDILAGHRGVMYEHCLSDTG